MVSKGEGQWREPDGGSAINDQPTQDSDRSSCEKCPITREPNTHGPSLLRGLVRDQLALAQFPAPVWTQTAVRGACDRVLVDTGCRRKESGDEIDVWRISTSRNDDASCSLSRVTALPSPDALSWFLSDAIERETTGKGYADGNQSQAYLDQLLLPRICAVTGTRNGKHLTGTKDGR